MNEGALSGLRVIDISQDISGPYCARLFAGMGAEVIKVEPPGIGDSSRRDGPFPEGGFDLNSSGRFLYLNANKKSVTLDLESPEGSDIFKQLLGDADVLIESYDPGVMNSMGLGFDTVHELNSRLVMASISFFRPPR